MWLIYAGQTAYDLRYRKADCVHFLFAFLQFVVFCSMATFASKFNIESSLSSTTANTMQFMLNSTTPSQILDVEADTFRNNHRLVINAKGISFVMGLNRLFLLLEYGVGEELVIFDSWDGDLMCVTKYSFMQRRGLWDNTTNQKFWEQYLMYRKISPSFMYKCYHCFCKRHGSSSRFMFQGKI